MAVPPTLHQQLRTLVKPLDGADITIETLCETARKVKEFIQEHFAEISTLPFWEKQNFGGSLDNEKWVLEGSREILQNCFLARVSPEEAFDAWGIGEGNDYDLKKGIVFTECGTLHLSQNLLERQKAICLAKRLRRGEEGNDPILASFLRERMNDPEFIRQKNILFDPQGDVEQCLKLLGEAKKAVSFRVSVCTRTCLIL
jgi:hypothetical protein